LAANVASKIYEAPLWSREIDNLATSWYKSNATNEWKIYYVNYRNQDQRDTGAHYFLGKINLWMIETCSNVCADGSLHIQQPCVTQSYVGCEL